MIAAVSAFGSAPFVPVQIAEGAQVPAAAGAADIAVAAPSVPRGAEVPSLESARSRVWRKPDGGFVTRVYASAVNERGADGAWQPIDSSLHAVVDGSMKADVGDGAVSLPATLSEPLKLQQGDDWLRLSLRGASDGGVKSAGQTASYAGIADGVDARLSAGPGGVKEDLILRGADAEAYFVYDADLSAGLSLREREDGGVDVVDASGDVKFAIPAPRAVDASGEVAPSSATHLRVSGQTITVSLDRDWLASQGRAFPVVLDPSAVMGAARDCYLDALNTTTSYCSAGELWAGSSSGHDHKALTYFSVAGTVPETAQVQEATLNLYPLYQTSPGTSKTLSAHRVQNTWDGSATWVKRTASANWSAAGGDLNATKLNPQGVPGSGQWSEFAITDLVTSWLDGSVANQGVAVTDDGSTADNSVVYASTDWADPNARPYVDIEWYANTGARSDWTMISQQLTDRSSLGVNVADGNLLLSSSDLQVASTGIPVSLNRSYNSQAAWSGLFGSKNRLSVGNDVALFLCDGLGSRCLIGPSGTRLRFTRNSDGSFNTPAGAGNVTLRRAAATSGRFTLTDNGSGVKYGFFDNDYSYVDTIDDRDGNHLGLEFHGTGNALSKITDSRGRSYTVATDGNGQITSVTVPTTVIAGGQTWGYGYTGDLLTSVTDPEGYVTTYTYDGSDQLTKVHDPRGNDTIIAYNAYGEVASVTRKVDGTTANDVTTTFSYIDAGFDSFCPTTTAGGGITTGETTVTDPNGNVSKYCFNFAGQVLKVHDPKGNDASKKFNSLGNATSTQDAWGNVGGGTSASASTTTNYDPTGMNPTQLTDAAGSVTTLGYPTPGSTPDPDKAAHATSVTVNTKNKTSGARNTTNYTYDASYHVTQVQSNTSALKSTLTYRSDGQISTAKDGNLSVTTYGYNTLGELTSVTPPPVSPSAIGASTYTYDGLSRVKTVTDGRGKTQTFGYDKLGQITSIADSDGSTTTFGYDGDGNVVSRVTGTASTSYGYDKLNRKTSETFPGSVTNGYTYDKNSNLKTLTDPSGTVSYTYDPLNRTATVVAPTATTGTDTTSYVYNDPGSTSAGSTHSNVVQTLPGGGVITTTADLAGKTTDLLVKTSGGTQQVHRTWAYDSSIGGSSVQGEVVSKMTDYGTSGTAQSTTLYAYGEAGMLAESQKISGTAGTNIRDEVYAYDPAGNRTSRVTTLGTGSPSTTSYGYNADNELCWQFAGTAGSSACGSAPTGSTLYTYDAAGNQLAGSGSTFAWDARNRLKTIGSSTVTHLSPTNNELTAIGSDSFQNTLLGAGRITTGGTLAKLVRNPNDQSVVSQVKSSVKVWLITDNLGSTIALVNSSGALQRTYDYDTDGAASTTAVVSGSQTTNITYAGGHDTGSGLIHFGSRYYQPSTGRWTQPDPLDQPGDLGQQNRYLYVGNDPVNGVDSTGYYTTYYSRGRKIIRWAEKKIHKTIGPWDSVWDGAGRTVSKGLKGTVGLTLGTVARCGAHLAGLWDDTDCDPAFPGLGLLGFAAMKPFIAGVALALLFPILRTDSLGSYRWPVAVVVGLLLVFLGVYIERSQIARRRKTQGRSRSR